MKLETTKSEIKSAIKIVVAITATIRELGSVPSGVLYSHLMGKVGLAEYQSIIRLILATGLVSQSGHMLTWVGK